MSGRLHIFMLPEYQEKLLEFTDLLGITENPYGASHAVHSGLDYVMDMVNKGTLPQDKLDILTNVPDPVNYGHLTVFLRQETVNYAFKFIHGNGMSRHDYALSHICAQGFLWLFEKVKAGEVDGVWLNNLKNVQPPKKVMYG